MSSKEMTKDKECLRTSEDGLTSNSGKQQKIPRRAKVFKMQGKRGPLSSRRKVSKI